jgi:hypothetical protein
MDVHPYLIPTLVLLLGANLGWMLRGIVFTRKIQRAALRNLLELRESLSTEDEFWQGMRRIDEARHAARKDLN